ncbi:MAG: hypothetical protein O7B23_01605 [Deltaproteobacteria bacterium]|nr:hypothetical protein [Deltaproteobacteria bacterium]
MRVSIILIGLGLALGVSTSVWAVDPRVKCVADKVKEAGNYSACRFKAESKAIKKGEAPDYSKCDSKYSAKWQKAESKAAGACPTNGDEAAIQAQVQQFVDELVAVLEPPAPCVGVGGACWFLGASEESCDTVCADAGLAYDPATETYAGSGGTLLQCHAVLDALGQTSPPLGEFGDADCSLIGAPGMGCSLDNFSDLRGRCTSPATTSSAGFAGFERACACQ